MAAVAVWLVRALAFTILTVDGDALAPTFSKGDRVVVNRWSYGLRTGTDGGLFGYDRIVHRPVERGDIVAFDLRGDSISGIFVCRCKAVPGDTVVVGGSTLIVPGLTTCAKEDYYWLESISDDVPADSRSFGFIPERRIIGRVCMVVYNHNDSLPLYQGYDSERLFVVDYDNAE